VFTLYSAFRHLEHLHCAAEFLAQIPKSMPGVASGLAGPNFGQPVFAQVPKAHVFPFLPICRELCSRRLAEEQVSGPLSKNGCKGRLHIAGLILSDVRHTSRTKASLVVDNSEACCRRQGVLIVPYCGIWNAHLIAQHIASEYAAKLMELESQMKEKESNDALLLCVTRTRVPYIASATLVHRNTVNSNALSFSPHSSLSKHSDQTSLTP
jgi:hypothetical protein